MFALEWIVTYPEPHWFRGWPEGMPFALAVRRGRLLSRMGTGHSVRIVRVR
jgi:hypothetical protein